MKKILVYGNRKTDDVAYDCSTPELEEAAFLKLFNMLNSDWQVYECGDLNAVQKKLYTAALGGNAKSARRLLELRKTYEYEEWSFVTVK